MFTYNIDSLNYFLYNANVLSGHLIYKQLSFSSFSHSIWTTEIFIGKMQMYSLYVSFYSIGQRIAAKIIHIAQLLLNTDPR